MQNEFTIELYERYSKLTLRLISKGDYPKINYTIVSYCKADPENPQ